MLPDHPEAVNRASMTNRTYRIAVEQRGAYLDAQGMPHEPAAVTREHLIQWMRYLPRPKADGGQGVGDASVVQRYRRIQAFFKWMVETDEIHESPMAKMRPPFLPEKLVPVINEGDLMKVAGWRSRSMVVNRGG